MPELLSTPDLLRVHPRDDALVALSDVQPGEERVPRPLSDLVLGLKCGGSDAFSGLTANRNGERELAIWKTGVTL